MNRGMELELTAEDHDRAFIEVSFLLDIFAVTIDDLMGGATASVGRIAGRHMARKLPVYLPTPTLEEVLQALADNLRKGFEISFHCQGETAEVQFGRCAIRQVCAARALAPGGPLCRLFHYYADGMVNELLYRPVKSSVTTIAEKCTACLQVR